MPSETKWPHLMIDIECAGTHRDSALMAIGAACFDMASMTIGPTFYMGVHLATSVNLGMVMYPDAVLWWLRQSEAARSAVAYNLVDITYALNEFAAFIEKHGEKGAMRTWGNAASFDQGILSTAYKLAEIELPWSWSKEMCFRTVRNHYPKVPYEPSERKTVHHNALDDSVFQVEHLFKIKRSARG